MKMRQTKIQTSEAVGLKTSTNWQKNFIYSTITLLSNALVPLITYPYLSRTLGAEGLGRYNFSFAFAQVFFLLAQAGLPYFGAREIAKASGDKQTLAKTAGDLTALNLLFGLVLSLVYVAAVFAVPAFREEMPLFLVLSLIVLLAPFLFNWTFQGLENFRYVAFRNLTSRALGLVLMFVFVKNANHVLRYAIIMVIVMVGHVGLSAGLAKQATAFTLKRANPAPYLRSAVFSTPVLLVSVALVQVGALILGGLSTKAEVAYYSVPAQVIMALTGVMTALSFVMVPRLTHLLKQGKAAYESTAIMAMQFSYLLVFPIAAGLFAVADDLVVVFAGQDFLPAADALRVGAPRMILSAIIGFAGAQVLIANGQEKKVFSALLFGLAILTGVGLWLIPELGRVGAMGAVLLAEVGMSAFLLVTGRQYFSVNMFINKAVFKYAALSLPILMLAFIKLPWAPYVRLIMMMIVSIIYYGLALILAKDPLFDMFLKEIRGRYEKNR